MTRINKAYIPYKGYYSTPFCRWQGSLANENSVVLGGMTASRWVKKRKIDPTIIDGFVKSRNFSIFVIPAKAGIQ